MNENLPPASIEAEEAILGAILFDPKAIANLCEWLPVEAFYATAHRSIYSAARLLHSQNRGTDLISLSTYLSDQKRLEEIGGTTTLARLLNRTISGSNVDRYGLIVLEKYKRRKLIALGAEISALGYDQVEELSTIYAKIKSMLPDEIKGASQEEKQPVITKAVYTIKSSSGQHEIQLEAEVDNGRGITRDIGNLKSRCEGLGRQLWEEYVEAKKEK